MLPTRHVLLGRPLTEGYFMHQNVSLLGLKSILGLIKHDSMKALRLRTDKQMNLAQSAKH